MSKMVKMFGWVIGGGCFLVGIGFLFFTKSVKRANQMMNEMFYPLENLEKLFRKEIKSDQWIASKTKVLGIISLLVSIIFFVVLLAV